MFEPGDVCLVNQRADKALSGIYRSLIGKLVVIQSKDTINDKYPVRVLRPDKDKPWELSEQLQIKEELLTKEK